MKNLIKIDTDGINLYVTLKVMANPIGLTILGAMILGVVAILFTLFSGIDNQEIGKYLLPILFITILFVFLPLRYLCWNIWGTENLTINTKIVSAYYDYGFITTNPKVVNFQILGTGYEKVSEDNKGELGKLLLYNYRDEDDLPELIYETTILIDKEEIEALDSQITALFERTYLRKHGFIGYSLN